MENGKWFSLHENLLKLSICVDPVHSERDFCLNMLVIEAVFGR